MENQSPIIGSQNFVRFKKTTAKKNLDKNTGGQAFFTLDAGSAISFL
jgi:hypothetical protein